VAHTDVAAQLAEDDIVHDDEHGQDEMCPEAVVHVLAVDVADGELVEARIVAAREVVERQEGGKQDGSNGDEDVQQHAQVAQEEIGIETACLDEGAKPRYRDSEQNPVEDAV